MYLNFHKVLQNAANQSQSRPPEQQQGSGEEPGVSLAPMLLQKRCTKGHQSTTMCPKEAVSCRDIATAPGVQEIWLVAQVPSRVLALLSVQPAAASGSTGKYREVLLVPGSLVTSRSNAVSGHRRYKTDNDLYKINFF